MRVSSRFLFFGFLREKWNYIWNLFLGCRQPYASCCLLEIHIIVPKVLSNSVIDCWTHAEQTARFVPVVTLIRGPFLEQEVSSYTKFGNILSIPSTVDISVSVDICSKLLYDFCSSQIRGQTITFFFWHFAKKADGQAWSREIAE